MVAPPAIDFKPDRNEVAEPRLWGSFVCNGSGILIMKRIVGLVLLMLSAPAALAVPGFARQTGLACNACHVRFPELTALGREFKLSGYTMIDHTKQIEASDSKQRDILSLPELPPVSVMFQAAYTGTAKSVPDTQNDDAQFPEQLSVFLAGKIAPRIGSFIQMTYTQQDDKFGIDNAELRFANETELANVPIQFGVSLNNSPTVEDLWNSTPVWGFPWAGPDVSPTPAAAPLLEEGLAQDVAGIGSYAMFDDTVYVAATLYRSAHLGTGAPTTGSENTIDGVAPYWRVAWQKSWSETYLEIGAYGLRAKLIPQGVEGPTNDFTDVAGDFQFERPIGDGTLTLHGTFIREDQNLTASVAQATASSRSNSLDSLRLDGGYHVGNWMATLGYFSLSGSADPTLYAPAPVDGSSNGKPDSRGFIAQLAYFPWLNTQFTLQYTGYDKFNGRSNSYDGSGRDASDNDALFLVAWFAW
jgi:hypothetical protein